MSSNFSCQNHLVGHYAPGNRIDRETTVGHGPIQVRVKHAWSASQPTHLGVVIDQRTLGRTQGDVASTGNAYSCSQKNVAVLSGDGHPTACGGDVLVEVDHAAGSTGIQGYLRRPCIDARACSIHGNGAIGCGNGDDSAQAFRGLGDVLDQEAANVFDVNIAGCAGRCQIKRSNLGFQRIGSLTDVAAGRDRQQSRGGDDVGSALAHIDHSAPH